MRKPAGKNTMKATCHAVWHALQTELLLGQQKDRIKKKKMNLIPI
jgi:hypothetical protein